MSSESLSDAFLAHRARIDAIVASGEWHHYGDEFTEDAVHRRSGTPDIVGREAIREWTMRLMSTYPGNEIVRIEVVWFSADEDLDAVVYELRFVMSDPGDGSVVSASTTASIHRHESGLWDWVTEANNPRAFRRMWETWAQAARRSGVTSPPVLPDEAAAGDHLHLDLGTQP